MIEKVDNNYQESDSGFVTVEKLNELIDVFNDLIETVESFRIRVRDLRG